MDRDQMLIDGEWVDAAGCQTFETENPYLDAPWALFPRGAPDDGDRVIPIDKPGMVDFTREEPLGVVAAITPWNSPLMLAAWKLAPALAAGNTVVWKPSEFSSVSALEFRRLFEKAGFPAGVVNILTGFGSEIGERLVSHPHVAKIAFTGGDWTGQGVCELAARSIKPVTLELGGKSANIVLKDAVLDSAVKGVVSGIFAATGQTRIARSRALVHRSLHDEFVEPLVSLGRTARKGDPALDSTQDGPGTTEVKPSMRVAQEEVFGSALSTLAFDDEEEAIEIANDTQFGVAEGVWTQSQASAFTMAHRLEAGAVWINADRATSYLSPFGGYKRTGIGRDPRISAGKSVWIDTVGEVANPFVQR